MYDLDREREDAYSHTGNSWNQSDIDSEYHRFDPKRYPPRQNPQDSMTVSRTSYSNNVTQFGDIVQRRLAQRPPVDPSRDNSSLTVKSDMGRRKQGSSRKRTRSRGKQKQPRTNQNSDMTGIMTQQEIEELQNRISPKKLGAKPSTRNFHDRKFTAPDIELQNVDREPLIYRNALETRDGYDHQTKAFFDEQELQEALHSAIQLKKNMTQDHEPRTKSPSFRTEQSNLMMSESTGGAP